MAWYLTCQLHAYEPIAPPSVRELIDAFLEWRGIGRTEGAQVVYRTVSRGRVHVVGSEASLLEAAASDKAISQLGLDAADDTYQFTVMPNISQNGFFLPMVEVALQQAEPSTWGTSDRNLLDFFQSMIGCLNVHSGRAWVSEGRVDPSSTLYGLNGNGRVHRDALGRCQGYSWIAVVGSKLARELEEPESRVWDVVLRVPDIAGEEVLILRGGPDPIATPARLSAMRSYLRPILPDRDPVQARARGSLVQLIAPEDLA